MFVNNTPIKWFCKRQKTVETSTYGSELVAARIAVEIILEVRFTLRMMGIPVEKTSWLLGDNMSVLLNTTIPSSMLKKKHLGVSYHRVREAIAARIILFSHIPSESNFADLLTKPLSSHLHNKLTKQLLFRCADIINQAANMRQIRMVTRIPTDLELDESELLQRCRDIQWLFNLQRSMAMRLNKYHFMWTS